MPRLIDPGIPVATREGTQIPNTRPMERSPAQRQASAAWWRRLRPDARLRSSTATYNCLGLAFASRRTLIEPEHLQIILAEDDYRSVSDVRDAQVGDLVIYGERGAETRTHVGIIVSKVANPETGDWSVSVMSKWGREGEYIHPLDHVPEAYGEPVEFRTDRRT